MSYACFWRAIMAARRLLEREGLAAGDAALMWMDNLLQAWVLEIALRSLGVATAMLRSSEQIAQYAAQNPRALITLADERVAGAPAADGLPPIEVGPRRPAGPARP